MLKEYVGKGAIMYCPESIHDEEMYISNATTGIIDCNVDFTEMMGAETFLYLNWRVFHSLQGFHEQQQ